MTIELKVPHVGESIQEVQVGRWLKQAGDQVALDENLVELETDKASMEIPSPSAGKLTEIVKREGDAVAVGDVIAYIDDAAVDDAAGNDSGQGNRSDKAAVDEGAGSQPAGEGEGADVRRQGGNGERAEEDSQSRSTTAARESAQGAAPGRTAPSKLTANETTRSEAAPGDTAPVGRQDHGVPVTPSARRALRKHGLTAQEVAAEGKRLRPGDIARHLEQHASQPTPTDRDAGRKSTTGPQRTPDAAEAKTEHGDELEQIVPMSLIRRRIAKRLVEAQQTAALLTTFNEIDMSAVMQLRERHRERFQEKYGIKLGLMSFFVKGVIDGLKQFPGLNAEIRGGDQIAYRNYYHVGVAIGGGQGLVVPVLRHAERLSFADVERGIADFAARAQQRQLKPQELEGGTFTISNGGVYGSLLSTPIVNPPQSGVLGMHAIQQRPVARDGQVVVRPMMYVALTYDHRIVDGHESVAFLSRVKEALEDPARMLIEA